jgi:hypothetical protein
MLHASIAFAMQPQWGNEIGADFLNNKKANNATS